NKRIDCVTDDDSIAAHFLHLLHGKKPSALHEACMNTSLVLYAEHEFNASTFTARVISGTLADIYSSISGAIGALSGPKHGGANEACLNMLDDIQKMGGISKVGEFMEQVKDKNSGVKLMGFGHRVYKNYDPRAKLMQETCNEVLAELGLENDPLFKLAKQVEKIALEDDYFVSRKLYPNVDFYSGIVQRAIGIPVNLFTGVFALARTVGWIAQLNEMIGDPEYKIGRPRQLFTGSPRRNVPGAK
ncbi:MAG: citrate (Si)-synthase, partial [Betaproteobacteria bacterium]|nr:citrate (Si)-synthase [Betaproteobacteria bacterium]